MYKKVLILACIIAVTAYITGKAHAEEHKPEGNGLASDNQSHKYIGVSKCKMCHASEAKGNQYKIWAASKHAQAYADLSSDAAKKTAEKVGLKTDPQKSAECLKCHETAFGLNDGLKEAAFNIADGVQCESCHGAGADYKGLSVMKDKQQAIAAGLVIPTKETCVKCHNSESPNYKDFNYEKSFSEIAHPAPKK